MANRNLEIGGIRGIRHAKFLLPEKGILVLNGPNGAGKSTTLEGMSDLASGDKTALRPGADQEAGFVSVCGATMRIGKSTRRTGEAEVRLFGSSLIEEIVDPGVEDGAKADLRRMKGIAKAKGAKADAAFFAAELELDADEMGGLFPNPQRTDLVDYCATGKKNMLDEASRLEKLAEQARADADAANRTAVDLRNGLPKGDLPTAAEAQQKLEAALQSQTLAATAAKARQKLEAMGPAPDWDELLTKAANGKRRMASIDAEIEKLRAERADLSAAVASDEGKLQGKAARDGLQEQAEASALSAEDAEAYVIECRQIMGAVSTAGTAKAQEEKNAAKLREFNSLSEKAAAYRVGAGKLDGLLAKSLNLEGRLQWKRDRLVDVERKGADGKEECFHVLSPGLRVQHVVKLLAPILPPDTVLALPQEFWEGLDEAGKNMANDAIVAEGLVAITAEAHSTEDGQIEAVVYENQPLPAK